MLSSMRARISQRQAPMPYLYSYYHTYNHTCTYIHVHTRSNPFMHGYHPFTNGCHPFTHRWHSRSRTILHPFMNGWAVRVGGRVWVITVEHRWLRCTHRYKQKTVREQVFPIYARTCITVRELAPVRARLISVHERVAFAFGDKHIYNVIVIYDFAL